MTLLKMNAQKICLFFTSCILKNHSITNANYIRSDPSLEYDDDDNEEIKVRQLDWSFVTEMFDDDKFFGDYDKKEIPSSKNKRKEGDRKDYLRNDDVCPGEDGSFKRSNCPKPPKCFRSKDTLGIEKLCINRAFVPGSEKRYYVAAMKCIPEWENCDKCFCGYMKESYAKTGYCKWDDSPVNDDRVDVNCDNLSEIKIMGRKYNYGDSFSNSDDSKSRKSESKSKKSESKSDSSKSKSKSDSSKSSKSDASKSKSGRTKTENKNSESDSSSKSKSESKSSDSDDTSRSKSMGDRSNDGESSKSKKEKEDSITSKSKSTKKSNIKNESEDHSSKDKISSNRSSGSSSNDVNEISLIFHLKPKNYSSSNKREKGGRLLR